jgi:hypothetical protein
VSDPSVWTASYVKRCIKIWRRSAINMDQMLKEFGEKSENTVSSVWRWGEITKW